MANGTKVRRQKQWSRTSYETSYGGVQLDPNERDELAAQLAHGKGAYINDVQFLGGLGGSSKIGQNRTRGAR